MTPTVWDRAALRATIHLSECVERALYGLDDEPDGVLEALEWLDLTQRVCVSARRSGTDPLE